MTTFFNKGSAYHKGECNVNYYKNIGAAEADLMRKLSKWCVEKGYVMERLTVDGDVRGGAAYNEEATFKAIFDPCFTHSGYHCHFFFIK